MSQTPTCLKLLPLIPATAALREWCEGFFVRLRNSDAGGAAIAQYFNTLTIWERTVNDPPLKEITQLLRAAIRTTCQGSPAIIAAHAGHLDRMPAKPPVKTPDIAHSDEPASFVWQRPIDLALFAVVAATTGSRKEAIRRRSAATFPMHRRAGG